MEQQYIMLIVIVVVFGGMMWWQSKKAKQQQQEKQDFRRNLQPGTEVITIGQVIARSSKSTSSMRRSSSTPKAPSCVSASTTIAREYTRPAYVSDDESTRTATRCPTKTPRLRLTMRLVRLPIEASVVSEEDTADETVTTTKPRRSKLFDSVAPSAYRIAKA